MRCDPAAEQRAQREPADRAGQRPADEPRQPARARGSCARGCSPTSAPPNPRAHAATGGCSWRRRAPSAEHSCGDCQLYRGAGERGVCAARRSGELFVDREEPGRRKRCQRRDAFVSRSSGVQHATRAPAGRRAAAPGRPRTAPGTSSTPPGRRGGRNITSSRHCAATSAQNTNAHASSHGEEVRPDAVKPAEIGAPKPVTVRPNTTDCITQSGIANSTNTRPSAARRAKTKRRDGMGSTPRMRTSRRSGNTPSQMNSPTTPMAIIDRVIRIRRSASNSGPSGTEELGLRVLYRQS